LHKAGLQRPYLPVESLGFGPLIAIHGEIGLFEEFGGSRVLRVQLGRDSRRKLLDRLGGTVADPGSQTHRGERREETHHAGRHGDLQVS
jgi:hypothetical protein